MEHGSVVLSAAPHRQGHPALFWAACGTIFSLGVFAMAMAPATTNTHVNVQPAVDLQVGMLKPGLTQKVTAAGRRQAAGPLPAAPVPPPTPLSSAGIALGGANFSWLSIAAITVSAVAIVTNFWRRSEPAYAPAPVSADYGTDSSIDGVSIRRPTNQMDQVAIAIKEEQARAKTLTPKEVILDLQRGNARFWSGTPERPELNAMERRALIIAQAPSVCILSCADSRVPVEIVFDQGLGRIFVVRVAGNILDSTAMGSIEFSVKYLGVKVLLVMGHEGCGAVKGAMAMSPSEVDLQPAYLQSVLRSIQANLNVPQLNKIRDARAQDREAIIANTSSQVKRLLENQLVASRVANGSLMVCGAFYEITSGIVDFFSLDKNGLVIDV